MLKLLPNLPAKVVGIVASGQVTASDYETVLIPAIESVIKEHRNVRVLYQLGPDFTGFSAGAMWEDLKTGTAYFKAWERIAVVTDLAWVTDVTRFLGFAMPCPVKVFANSELSDATNWLAG